MTVYDHNFYRHQMSGSYRSARRVVPVLQELIPISSVCDVGCGVGTWLSVFREKGVSDTLGIDGGYVDRSLIRIPGESFREADLREELRVPRRFDLAMSLEVAEHLPERRARGFVDNLTRLAPVVLFSAAIPGQGGVNHVNEQWQTWWASILNDLGFLTCDALRPRSGMRMESLIGTARTLWCSARRRHWRPILVRARADHTLRLPLVHPENLSFRDSLRAVGAAIRRMPKNFKEKRTRVR